MSGGDSKVIAWVDQCCSGGRAGMLMRTLNQAGGVLERAHSRGHAKGGTA